MNVTFGCCITWLCSGGGGGDCRRNGGVKNDVMINVFEIWNLKISFPKAKHQFFLELDFFFVLKFDSKNGNLDQRYFCYWHCLQRTRFLLFLVIRLLTFHRWLTKKKMIANSWVFFPSCLQICSLSFQITNKDVIKFLTYEKKIDEPENWWIELKKNEHLQIIMLRSIKW